MEAVNSSNMSSNITDFSYITDESDYYKTLKKCSDYITVFVLISIMFSMGLDIELNQLRNHIRRPFGVVIGMVCQFVFMPVLGYMLVIAFKIENAYALSVLIVSTCPGGAISNLVCYYLDGDVSLSVTMTSVSTLLAMGFLPLNLWIYGTSWTKDQIIVPYGNIAMSMVFITSPVAVGMFVKWKKPNVATTLTKVISTAGSLLIVVAIVLQNLAYPQLFLNLPWQIIVISLIMPAIGSIFGFLIAKICRQSTVACKTISVESGIQNVATALGVIAVSPFSFETQEFLCSFPMLYGISMISLSFMACSAFNIYKIFHQKNSKNSEVRKEDKEENISML